MSPDFLCIGAQKAGTTWLYDQLRQLDLFALTPIKELHYFDRDPAYISPNTVSITKFQNRLIDPRWCVRVAKDFRRIVRDKGSFEDFRFLWHWHSMNYSDKSYKRLFDKWEKNKIKGEITPSYSFLLRKDIERIYQINPEIKIVFLLRDPIDRSWSHCRFYKPDITYSIRSLIEFIDGDLHTIRGDYLSTIESYKSVFPKNQILLAYFDGISIDPLRLLSEITQFLGGRSFDLRSLATLSKKSNPSANKDIPDEVYEYLKSKYEKQIRLLASDHGSFANKWLETHFKESADKDFNKFTFHP